MVTVLMSVYNSAKYLHPAIRSTLRQSHRNFEFLIVDDGSSDDSLAICRRYAERDSRIRIIAHENRGAPAALNDAAARAAGDWLFRMDPDDVMLPNRLSRQLAFLRRNKDLAVASSQVFYIDRNGKTVGQSRSPLTTRAAVAATVAGPGLIALCHPAVAMRKDVFTEVGGYRPQYWPADDLDLWTRIAERGYRVLVQDEFLLKYRLHGASISMSRGRVQAETTEWVQDSKQRRQRGAPEQSLQAFLEERHNQPLAARLNWRRKVVARTLYKRGVQGWTVRDYLRSLPALAAAFALYPSLFAGRVLPRLIGGMGRPSESPQSATAALADRAGIARPAA